MPELSTRTIRRSVCHGLLSLLSAWVMAATQTRLPYDPHAYETAPQFAGPCEPWAADDLDAEIRSRVAAEKQRRELDVYYYRIGYTLSFPLPVSQRPAARGLPSGVLAKTPYPWLIWLSWDLEERWRVLHTAWRQSGDVQAGELLQRELAALAGWDRFHETYGDVGLVTAHFAASLSQALENERGWNADCLKAARQAADSLIERDVWPWFEKTWKPRELTTQQLGNIPVITLMRAAQLARVVKSPRLEALDARSREVLHAWCRFRTGPEQHTEGACYDGYLLDAMTEWLDAQPDREQLVADAKTAFRSQADQWIQLTLPGRTDLHVALGDDEPEMTYWATALARLCAWYGWSDAAWVLRHFQPSRMRAAALIAARRSGIHEMKTELPATGTTFLPNAVVLRTGWKNEDLLLVVGASGGSMGHLQADGGQLILASRGRSWISDPGYQQYRPGEERDFTLGTFAHNAPVIDGTTQTVKAARIESTRSQADGVQHVQIDLGKCYRGLPTTASVVRDVWVTSDPACVVVVRDMFTSLTRDVEIRTSWLGGTGLAWGFAEGWSELSDGDRAFWIGCAPGALDASGLIRHPGSRGPLTLTHSRRFADGNGVQWWVFCGAPGTGNKPPALTVSDDGQSIRLGKWSFPE